jgi:predicted HAD superfamily Cof-like phosphohydrolase
VPKVPTNERVALRRRLIEEEYEELIEALDEGDLAHIAKEAADVIVVVLGAMAEYGIPFDEVWKAVHASNMAKVGEDGKVARREDGKVLKPDGWEPPNIEKIIDEAIGRQEEEWTSPDIEKIIDEAIGRQE